MRGTWRPERSGTCRRRVGIRDRAVVDKVGDAHTGEIVKMRAQLDAIGGLAGGGSWGKVESIGILVDHVQKIQNSHMILYILPDSRGQDRHGVGNRHFCGKPIPVA